MSTEPTPYPICDECAGTGICGDEGPGKRNAMYEWQPCDCPNGDIHRVYRDPVYEERAKLRAGNGALLGRIGHLSAENAALRARLLQRTEAQVAAGVRDQARFDGLLQILKDPHAVHINMLRGTIAWTPEHLRHVIGEG